jgi:uncharacterized membrane protein YtjA (UPF0391 family)
LSLATRRSQPQTSRHKCACSVRVRIHGCEERPRFARVLCKERLNASQLRGGACQLFSLLHYAIMFLVFALIAAAVGFGGVAGVAMEGARLLFWIFIVLLVISLIASLLPRLAPY